MSFYWRKNATRLLFYTPSYFSDDRVSNKLPCIVIFRRVSKWHERKKGGFIYSVECACGPWIECTQIYKLNVNFVDMLILI